MKERVEEKEQRKKGWGKMSRERKGGGGEGRKRNFREVAVERVKMVCG